MYKHILVPVDGSEPSNGALRTAISLSKEMGARIRLLHVVDRAVYLAGYDPSGGVSADMFATLRDSGYRILRDAATAAISEGLEVDHLLLDDATGRLRVVRDMAASIGL